MLIECERKALLKGINFVSKALPTRSVLPVLEQVRVQAGTGNITLTATDLEMTLIASVEGTIILDPDEKGECLIQGKNLIKGLRISRSETVTIEGSRAKVTVSGEAGKIYEWLPIEPDEYPLIEFEKPTQIIAGLQDMLNKCVSFTSREETRHFLNGVYLSANGQVEAVATDGRRLVRIVTKQEVKPEYSAIIPTRTCQILARMKGKCKVLYDKDRILFETEDGLLITRLIEGEYPEYMAIIEPARNNEKLVLAGREALLMTLTQLLAVTQVSKNAKSITFDNERGILKLKATGQEFEKYEQEIPDSATDFYFAVNGDFMKTALESIGAAEVAITGRDELSPLMIKDGDTEIVMMPIRM